MDLLVILVLLSGLAWQAVTEKQKVCICSENIEHDWCCEEDNGNCSQFLHQESIQNGSVVVVCTKEMELTRKISFTNLENIVVTGYPDQTHIQCSGGGFQISACQEVKIMNLRLTNCGVTQNAQRGIASSIYVSNSMQITIENVHFMFGRGKGLIMLNSYGNVEHCLFEGNNNTQAGSNSVFGGGMYVEQNNNLDDTSNHSLNIIKCNFSSNEISFLSQESKNLGYVRCNSQTDFKGYNRGGGIAIFLRGNMEGANITIKDVQIQGNKAVWGGGLNVHFCNQAQQNKVLFENVNITENLCEMFGGGGVDIGFTYTKRNLTGNMGNSLEFQNCRFERNRAFFGGGTALYMSQSEFEYTAFVTFTGCFWIQNSAHYGAAIDMAPQLIKPSLHVHMPTIVMRNATFENNAVEHNVTGFRVNPEWENIDCYNNRAGLGKGTFLIAGLKVYFEGNVSFINNTGSAVYAISSTLYIVERTNACFKSNFGFKGGAIALVGFSYILVNQDVSVSLVNNTASAGGAIYHTSIDQHDYLFSQNCFIQKATRETARVEFKFVDNNAIPTSHENTKQNYGDSIFATTLIPCFEYCKRNSTVWCNRTFWCISEPSFETGSVATSGAYFTRNLTELIPIIPGKATKVEFMLWDDLDQQVQGLYHVKSNDSSKIFVDNIHTYTTGNTLVLGGEPGKTATITITKLGQREVRIALEFILDECPPFFRYNDSLKRCICANNIKADYQNIIICNSHLEFTTSLLHGYWAGYLDKQGKTECFRYGLCPNTYCFHENETERHHQLLHGKEELEKQVCGSSRSGVLCGKCKDNYCAHFHSNNFECGTCASCKYGWALYILSELIPLAILFLLVVIFNISFTSGLLNGFIFYAQVFDSIFSIGKSFIWYPKPTYFLTRVIQVVYKFFNFDFFGDNHLGFCLWRAATTLELLAFRFLTVTIAGFLVVSTVLLMKRCPTSKCLKAPPSMIHGLSAFLIMVYTQCTKISFQLLDFSRVLDLKGNMTRVLYYQGDMTYFSREHIPFASLAILCLSTLTLFPPLLLISYPLCYRVSALLRLDNTKFSRALGKLIPLSKMKPVFDSFQGCFKDRYRHFAGLYFAYRVVLLASVLTSDPILTNTMTQVLLIFMLTIHCLCWPYIRRLHNIIDGLILANLTLINAFTIFNYYYAQVGSTYQDTINTSTSIQILFVYAPFFYFIGITIFALKKIMEVKKPVNSIDDEIMMERLDCPDDDDKELTCNYKTLSVTY